MSYITKEKLLRYQAFMYVKLRIKILQLMTKTIMDQSKALCTKYAAYRLKEINMA
jgi:hypothetical protein